MPISFKDSTYSINRAKKHFEDFKRQVLEFSENDPCTQLIELDADTGERVLKYKLVKSMPDDLIGLATEIVNHLRSALDQAVFAFNPDRRIRGQYFPFASDETHFENAVRGRCKYLPQEIVDLIRRSKPYKGGNNTLWALNQLSGTSKHGFLTPIGMVGRSIFHRYTKVSGGVSLNSPHWNREKNEMEIARLRPGATMESNFEITIFIALCDVDFVSGQPAVAVLNEFINMVEGILMAFEGGARSLGL
jgi:hypothetical protein